MAISNGTPATNGMNGHAPSGEASPKKKLIHNAFVEMCKLYFFDTSVSHAQLISTKIGSGHQSPGLWRHPDDRSSDFNSVQHWIKLAKLLEKGRFHGMFIADVLGGYDVYGGPRNLVPAVKSGAQWPVNEPLCVVPAMAAATTSLGFGVTITTSYEPPYHLARRLSTVDHLSGGRYVSSIVQERRTKLTAANQCRLERSNWLP